jgi:C-terminal processing protease CtpA/Prc
VTAGQVTTVELAATRMGSGARIGRYSGLELENQLAEVLVKSVEPASPAAEAGIVVGDVVVKIEDETIGRDAAEMASRMIDYGEANPVKLVLERNDKQIAASIAF